MTRYQAVRGNPEQKLSVITDDFSGGINLVDENDKIGSNQLRYGYNFDIDNEGSLKKRKGFLASPIFKEIIDKHTIHFPLIPDRLREYYYRDTIYLNGNVSEQNQPFTIRTDFSHLKVGDILSLSANAERVKGEQVIDFYLYIKLGETVYSRKVFAESYATEIVTEIEIEEDVVYPTLSVWTSGNDRYLSQFLLAKKEEEEIIKTEAKDVVYFDIIKDRNNTFSKLIKSKNIEEFIFVNSSSTTPNVVGDPNVSNSLSADVVLCMLYRDYTNRVIAYLLFFDVNYGLSVFEQRINTLSRTTPVNVEGEDIFVNGKDIVNIRGTLYVPISHYNIYKERRDWVSDCILKIEDKSDSSTYRYEVSYIGKNTDGYNSLVSNSAYKPSPLEIRKVGFNMLGTNPLSWISDSVGTGKRILGAYLTLDENTPITYMPASDTFYINVMVTGISDFTVKFYQWVGDTREEIKATTMKSSRSTATLIIIECRLSSAPSTEVEMELTPANSKDVSVYRDYYDTAPPSRVPQPVEGIDTHGYQVSVVWDRLVLYGYNEIWYSDINRPEYIPSYNYIRLPFDRDSDEIVSITFFRSSYIIFTRRSIYKLSGGFGSADIALSPVSEVIGCIAPKSIKVVDNRMIFLSNRGLYMLKSEVFRTDMENVSKLDEKISPIFDGYSFVDASAYIVDNQYILHLNKNIRKRNIGVVDFVNKIYQVPDVVRFYYDIDAYVFDFFGEEYIPYRFNYLGMLFALRSKDLYEYKESPTDFGKMFTIMLETSGKHFGNPVHEKKFKKLYVKMQKQQYEQLIRVTVFVDGRQVLQEDIQPKEEVVYSDIVSNISDQRLIRMGSLKGRNIAVRISSRSDKELGVDAISVEWKLGKVRG